MTSQDTGNIGEGGSSGAIAETVTESCVEKKYLIKVSLGGMGTDRHST